MAENELQVSSEAGGNLHEMPVCVEVAESLGVAPKSLINTLKNNIMKDATPYELVAIMMTMQAEKLSPFLGQFSAFKHNGKIQICVEENGWVTKANERPGFLYVSYEHGKMVDTVDNGECYEYVIATVHDRDRGNIPGPKIWLREWYKRNDNWKAHPCFRLEQRAHNRALRRAYGFGFVDSFDREQMVGDGPTHEDMGATGSNDRLHEMTDNLRKATYEDAEVTEVEDVEGHEEGAVGERTREADPGEQDSARPEEPGDHGVGPEDPNALDDGEDRTSGDEVCETGEAGDGAEEEPPAQPASQKDVSSRLPSPGSGGRPLKCNAAGCLKTNSNLCPTCGAWWCPDHMSKDGIHCKVCGGGSGE